jgi:hypothetical protein
VNSSVAVVGIIVRDIGVAAGWPGQSAQCPAIRAGHPPQKDGSPESKRRFTMATQQSTPCHSATPVARKPGPQAARTQTQPRDCSQGRTFATYSAYPSCVGSYLKNPGDRVQSQGFFRNLFNFNLFSGLAFCGDFAKRQRLRRECLRSDFG